MNPIQDRTSDEGGGRRMPESTHLCPSDGGRLGAPQPTNLEERKSPLSTQITMQVGTASPLPFKFFLLFGFVWVI